MVKNRTLTLVSLLPICLYASNGYDKVSLNVQGILVFSNEMELLLWCERKWETERDVISKSSIFASFTKCSDVGERKKKGRARMFLFFFSHQRIVFSNLLISSIDFIFSTCYTSKKWNGVNGGFVNGAKMNSISKRLTIISLLVFVFTGIRNFGESGVWRAFHVQIYI